MGFGCNAAAVTGCRIIDSPRERLIAVLTNSLVPCNGRFPALITIVSIFFAGGAALGPAWAAAIMTALIVFSVLMTFVASRLLSATVLRGVPSAFTLELPPLRRPQIGQVLIRSLLDRTIFVLGRAASVAAPAGLIIWALANISVGGLPLLGSLAGLLDPFAALFGLDGVILLAFILALPANEIVLPIALMCYLASGQLVDIGDAGSFAAVLTANGWTARTAVCTMLFTLMHWPCATTLLTIYKETRSLRWTLVSILLPLILGFGSCFIVAQLWALLG